MAQFGTINMDWHKRFKAMKSGLVLTNSDIAKITGNSPDKEQPRSRKERVFFKNNNIMQTTIEQVHSMYRSRVKAELSADAEISIEASVKINGEIDCVIYIWHQDRLISCGVARRFTEAYNRAYSSAKDIITSSVGLITINAEQL